MTTTPNTFARALTSWYRRTRRDLPWRRTRDPYLIWISEVMLQQTTVKAVIPYFERWQEAFPDVGRLAAAPAQAVLKMWQGLGYYQRARNLHAAAKHIIAEHDGRLPEDPDILRGLPGFGPYTTGAVLSIAFGQRRPIIDANVRRVVMRQLGRRGLANTSQDKTVLEFLDEVMPRKGIGDFNQALMELGALVCRSRNPLCLSCPVQKSCEAFRQGIQEIIPTPKKAEVKNVAAAIAVLEDRGRYFIQQRPPGGLLGDLWEFPGGKIESGEAPEEALRREIREELDVEISSLEPLGRVRHYYTQFCVDLHVWRCRVAQPRPAEDLRRKWVSRKQLKTYPMPSGSARIVTDLLETSGRGKSSLDK